MKKNKLQILNTHPEAEVNETKAKTEYREQSLSELTANVDGEIQSVLESRREWEDRQSLYYRKRYGIRGPKNFPWKGASNISIPTIDDAIRKLLPAYMALLWQPDRVAEFEKMPDMKNSEQLKQAAEANTHLLNHIIKDLMYDSFTKSVNWTDRMLQAGYSIVKVTYEYKTDQRTYTVDLNTLQPQQKQQLLEHPEIFEPEGEKALLEFLAIMLDAQGFKLDMTKPDEVKEMQRVMKKFQSGEMAVDVNVRMVTTHAPKWSVIKPQDFIIHGAFNNIQDAQMCVHRMYMTPNDLRKAAQAGKFGQKGAEVVDKILEKFKSNKLNSNNVYNTSKDTSDDYDDNVERLTGDQYAAISSTQHIEIRECGIYAMPDSYGVMRKCILTYCPMLPSEPLKFVVLPYDDQKWPFVRFKYEIKDDGFNSVRGVPAMLDYLATEINVLNNQVIDNLTLSNAPMLTYIPGQVNMSKVQYIPGKGVPIKSPGVIQPLIIPAGNMQGVEMKLRDLRSYAESYVRSPDFGQTDVNAASKEARTATETSLIEQQRNQGFILDTKIFLHSVQELLEMTWSRWMQYGSDEYEINVTGQPNPIQWRKDSAQTGMKIRPKGTLQGTNPQMRARAASELLQDAQNPLVGPMLKTYDIVNNKVEALVGESKGDFLETKENWQKAQQQQAASQSEQAKEQLNQQMLMEEGAAQAQHIRDMEMEKLKTKNEIAVTIAKGKVDRATKIAVEKAKPKETKNKAKPKEKKK